MVYLLTKGPKEPKFEPPKHPEYRMFFAGLLGGGNGTVEGGNATMEFITPQLGRSLGAPVLDRTGLTGPFDFTVENVYEPEEHDLVAIAQRTVSALGLRLEKSLGLVEMIVIDHLEKPSAIPVGCKRFSRRIAAPRDPRCKSTDSYPDKPR